MAFYGEAQALRTGGHVSPLRFAAILSLVVSVIAAGYFGAQLLQQTALKDSMSVNVASRPVKPLMQAEVVVAAREISAGAKLFPEMFAHELRTVDDVGQVFTDTRSLEGRFSAHDIARGATVLSKDIATTRTVNAVTAKIPPGQRAVTIAVDAVSGVEGWARPGSRVDVVWSTMHLGQRLVTTIVEKAEILSAEQSAQINPQDTHESKEMRSLPTHVTLLVSVADSQKVQLAKESGSLSLSLRGDDDTVPHGNETLTLQNLLSPIEDSYLRPHEGEVEVGGKVFELRRGKLVPRVQAEEKTDEQNVSAPIRP